MLKRYIPQYCLFCRAKTIHDVSVAVFQCTKCGRYRFHHSFLTRDGNSARVGGFTLVEMMIAVALVVLLSAVAIPSATRARQNAEDARISKELQSIYTAIVTFQTVNNRTPSSWDELNDYIKISDAEQKYELNPGG